jgi:Fe-S oxidoreductase
MFRLKEELLLTGNVPAELQLALENSRRYGNPMGESPKKRSAWTEGLDPPIPIMREWRKPVDVLWYVGDFASYHPQGQQAARALVKVFRALGVDFGILGPDEVSDGDSQRMAGERGLFEWLAIRNGSHFLRSDFNQIVTTDPHAYNAIKNEYPSLEINYPVQHYTEFLFERLDQLKPLLKNEINATVAYHDPCYLGRVNGIYDPPRELLKAIPGVRLVEMSHNHDASLCCGGGGGGMWLDGFQWDKAKERLSDWRICEVVSCHTIEDFMTVIGTLDSSRRKAGQKTLLPDETILAVACPYEKPRFTDATKTIEEARDIRVMDIAELLAKAM